ncbi:BREX-1 system adenine-specific DNA-methyltransferase PglX [Colwellia sp. Arc7-D]|uniref:BREX-1 system adenine-specific DNA-methyltransferase PglX n=1 Tax=Colwellia sp. Arc7-D TaxID=2161872 RepID=UPI000D3947C3|nr:BREX-1 system adenine-specific DNA-methyltransferase PglX [Colwellia sp. Arc7-D]AWB57836.1 BREX-1 system adenine-specific DNA-methyltransferase PglX [Colwellia sp. Arc7-D]
MNTKNLKAYAPKARSQFIDAIKKRAAQFGIYEDNIADIQFEGSVALIEGRAFTNKQGEQRKRLEQKISEKSLATHKERYDLFIREMAYTWFNRFAAIRYMELHDYLDHGFRVLSNPNSTDNLPEILDHASDVVDSLDPEKKYLDKNHIIELQLAGNKEEELYRELLLGQCHRLYNIMPFMFEAIDDATELLLPDNLTKTDSILKGLVNEIPEEDWREIEVIGWLYQFYISEHKDAVIGKVVKSEDIPAATQLFTPNWIVKYLVQNSLGRQWLATYPESELKDKMEYYIEPAQQSDDVIEQLKAITPTSIDPEEIKILDPAAGSGHILVEVYEVMREIYLERGYRLREIPELILTKNIYGLDIDDRAAQLACFALMMKAREDDRRIFQRVENGEVSLNVYSLQSTEGLDISKLWQALNLDGNQKQGSTGGLFDGLDDLSEGFVQPTGIYEGYFELLQTLKSAFLQAKTLGSLIQINHKYLKSLTNLRHLLKAKLRSSDPSSKHASNKLIPIVEQAILLSTQNDVVIANPPYMGIKKMNKILKDYVSKKYPNSKNDLFGVFMERGNELTKTFGFHAQVNMQSWMFLTSFSGLRSNILRNFSIISLAHLGARAFKEISGEIVQTTAWVLQKNKTEFIKPVFIRLIDGDDEVKRRNLINGNQRFTDVVQEELLKISDHPVSYWMPKEVRELFTNETPLSELASPKIGLLSTDNERFLRYWFEPSALNIYFKASDRNEAQLTNKKWFPYNKGGDDRKWFGNNEFIINWKNDGEEIKAATVGAAGGRVVNEGFYFKESVSASSIATSANSYRFYNHGGVFDVNFRSYFNSEDLSINWLLGFLNSNVSKKLISYISSTIALNKVDLDRLPFVGGGPEVDTLVNDIIAIYKWDWNQQETSYEFTTFAFLNENTEENRLIVLLKDWFKRCEVICEKAKTLEESLNKHFITDYKVKSGISSVISIDEITLNINPYYKYKSSQLGTYFSERATSKFTQDLISFVLGCMMGRYSLDQEGLIYASSSNEGFKELISEGAYKKFPADDDGIIPLACEEWLFDDDATARFKEFVKTVWGNEHLNENLEFVVESLCLHALKPKKGEGAMDTVRRYFSTQFFKDHCKTYKKRPIYWLFSSGKEKAFECLVYLHRYNEGTLSRMRTEYVTPLMGKYEAHHSMLTEQKLEATTAESRTIEKELKLLERKQVELRTFDDQLKHYAEKRITLDLDDGVKANYGKFGNLLADVKAIHGKAVK